MKKRILLVLVILSVLIFTACTAQNTTSSNSSSQNSSSSDQKVDYTIEMKNYSFSPNEITIDPGATIKVKLKNSGGNHDFVIDELNVRSDILAAGDEDTIEITAPTEAAGKTFQFYCSVSNHRAMGMVGTIKVKAQ